jgi:hypothetical protein
MDKLKNFIQTTNIPVPEKEKVTTSAKATPPPQGGEGSPKNNVKEVPEDVLRKILE